MPATIYCPEGKHAGLPCIRKVGPGEPWLWVKDGWTDFRRTWRQSLPYSAALGIVGAVLIYHVADQLYLDMALAGGFLLLGPILAAWFNQISSRLEWRDTGRIGVKPSVRRLLSVDVGLFGLVLAIVFAIWIDVATLISATQAPHELSASGAFDQLVRFGEDNPALIMTNLAVGGLLALLVYCIGVITLPLLLERRADLVTAMTTSLLVVRENPAAMTVWAVLIAATILAGMLTLFVGFAVLFPIVGHACWHSYRALIERG